MQLPQNGTMGFDPQPNGRSSKRGRFHLAATPLNLIAQEATSFLHESHRKTNMGTACGMRPMQVEAEIHSVGFDPKPLV